MRTQYFALVLVGLFLLTSSLDAQMRGGFGERGMRGERPHRMWLHEMLDLTAEQESRLSALRTAHQTQMIDKRAELQKIRISIREEMVKDAPDMTAVKNMIKKQEEIRTNLQLARVKHWNDVREILTPEQREIWQKHRRGFGEFGDRRGSWRRHSRGRW